MFLTHESCWYWGEEEFLTPANKYLFFHSSNICPKKLSFHPSNICSTNLPLHLSNICPKQIVITSNQMEIIRCCQKKDKRATVLERNVEKTWLEPHARNPAFLGPDSPAVINDDISVSTISIFNIINDISVSTISI